MVNNHANFKVEKMANFGTAEPWVSRIFLGLSDLINMLDETADNKKAITDSIGEIFEELSLAFIALKKVKELTNLKGAPVLELKKEYSDLYDHSWRAYKDRFATACSKMGYDIGFLFKDDKKFKSESESFVRNYPDIKDGFIQMLNNDRLTWQNGLSDFRNMYIQHKQIGYEIESKYYNIKSAENMFSNVWQTIEDTLVLLIESQLKDPLVIIEIPEEERDKSCPKRFMIGLKNPPA